MPLGQVNCVLASVYARLRDIALWNGVFASSLRLPYKSYAALCLGCTVGHTYELASEYSMWSPWPESRCERGVGRIPTQARPHPHTLGTSNKTHKAVQFFIIVRKYQKWLSQLRPPSHPWLLMPLPVHRNSRKHIFQLKLSTKYSLFSTNCSCVFIRWLFQDILRYVWVRFRSDSAMAFDQSLRRRLINWG